MTLDLSKVELIENEDRGRFEAHVGDLKAVMYRYYDDGSIVITHTLVPDELTGQGLAGHMARIVLDGAREQGLSVVPICPYVAAYIKRHPEYQDLVQRGPDQ
jgi:predicted GNAT family acetyltransferase